MGDFGLGCGGELQDHGQCAKIGDQRYGILEATVEPRMFEDQCGMNQIDWLQTYTPRGEVGAYEFQSRQSSIAPVDRFEVVGVYIQTDNPLCCCAVDMFQAVSASNAENCDRRR